MVLAYQDIMEVVRVLSEDRNMVVTVRESGKGALVTGHTVLRALQIF